jgi:hypothetical protein
MKNLDYKPNLHLGWTQATTQALQVTAMQVDDSHFNLFKSLRSNLTLNHLIFIRTPFKS